MQLAMSCIGLGTMPSTSFWTSSLRTRQVSGIVPSLGDSLVHLSARLSLAFGIPGIPRAQHLAMGYQQLRHNYTFHLRPARSRLQVLPGESRKDGLLQARGQWPDDDAVVSSLLPRIRQSVSSLKLPSCAWLTLAVVGAILLMTALHSFCSCCPSACSPTVAPRTPARHSSP